MAAANKFTKILSDQDLENIAEEIMNKGLETDSNFSDCTSEHSEHNSVSEEEYSSGNENTDIETETEDEDSNSVNYFYGKNRFKWAKNAPASSRTRAHNIISHLPGVIGEARYKNPRKPIQTWDCFIDEDILNILLDNTNKKITEMAEKYNDHNLSCQYNNHVDMIEMKAFLGLLYLSGVFKSNHEDLKSLFSRDGTGRDIFRATMTMNRFSFLLCALRFDDKEKRLEKIENGDRLAAISEIFNIFITNCQSNYSCGEYVTIDEMLIAFRGRCKFRMYLSKKPDKYGLKMQCLCDSRTNYLVNAFIYTGKNSHRDNPKKLSVPTLDVLSLIPPIINSNRNITADNWFTSMELVTELNKYNLTYVGTMKKNKRDIPSQFLPHKLRSANSSLFGFGKGTTLVSYVPKKNRAVILVSSMHHTNSIINDNKPEIIEFYNETKSGVDSLDQKCACYKVGRRTRRWPQAIWFRIMDVAGVNSNIIFNCLAGNKCMDRRLFLTSLGRDLIREHLLRRREEKNIPRELRRVICRISGVTSHSSQPKPDIKKGIKRGRCHICPYSQKKESLFCDNCQRFCCKIHASVHTICDSCEESDN